MGDGAGNPGPGTLSCGSHTQSLVPAADVSAREAGYPSSIHRTFLRLGVGAGLPLEASGVLCSIIEPLSRAIVLHFSELAYLRLYFPSSGEEMRRVFISQTLNMIVLPLTSYPLLQASLLQDK